MAGTFDVDAYINSMYNDYTFKLKAKLLTDRSRTSRKPRVKVARSRADDENNARPAPVVTKYDTDFW